MTEQCQPTGPVYLEFVFEKDGSNSADQIATAYIDGFDSEADAWKACDQLMLEPICAKAKDGGDVMVSPEKLVQILIAKRPVEKYFPMAAA